MKSKVYCQVCIIKFYVKAVNVVFEPYCSSFSTLLTYITLPTAESYVCVPKCPRCVNIPKFLNAEKCFKNIVSILHYTTSFDSLSFVFEFMKELCSDTSFIRDIFQKSSPIQYNSNPSCIVPKCAVLYSLHCYPSQRMAITGNTFLHKSSSRELVEIKLYALDRIVKFDESKAMTCRARHCIRRASQGG